MSVTKSIFRKFIFPPVTFLKLEKLLAFSTTNNRLILCYHGCNTSPNFKLNGRHIPARQLEEHFVYFKKNFEIISLNEMFHEYRENIPTVKKKLSITFDDGYLNNYTEVLPLLEKYKIPATFFIVSKSLEEDNFILWPEIIDIIRVYSELQTICIGRNIFHKKNGSYYSPEHGTSIYEFIKKMGSERDNLIEDLKLKCDFRNLIKKVGKESYKLMNRMQVIEFSASRLVDIGSHTHKHYNLANINHDLAQEELIKSKKIIEDALQKEIKSIAFPDGSYSEVIKKMSINAGYANLIAVPYQCDDDFQDKNILPRFSVSNATTRESNIIQINGAFRKTGF